jgi:hypothetical protein
MNALQAKISSGILILLALFAFSIPVPAQDDDGIYGDIYEISTAEEEIIDTVSPLDGYSTVDDYYPEADIIRTFLLRNLILSNMQMKMGMASPIIITEIIMRMIMISHTHLA